METRRIHLGEDGAVSLSIEDGLATLRLRREAKRNALTRQMWSDLSRALVLVQKDAEARVLLIDGGASFSAGADVTGLGDGPDGQVTLQEYRRVMEAALSGLLALPKPTVASINGSCLGAGCDLATACDIRIAADTSFFGVTTARMGLVFSPESCARLIAVVGESAARYMLLSAEIFDAAKAFNLGLVHEVVGQKQLPVAALEMSRRIANLAAVSHWGNKAVLGALRSRSGPSASAMRHIYDVAYNSSEYAEGRAAFAERRAPNFAGLGYQPAQEKSSSGRTNVVGYLPEMES